MASISKKHTLVVVLAAALMALLLVLSSRFHPRATPSRKIEPDESVRAAAWGTELPPAHARTGDVVWWEAEAPKATNFPSKNPFAPENAEQAHVLSGGAWIGVENPAEDLFLLYEISVPRSGRYNLFARKFWKHGPFRWRFDEQGWRECGRDVGLLDSADLRRFVGANWVDLGEVELSASRHSFRLELIDRQGAAAFDAFALTSDGSIPRGNLKPGTPHPAAPQGWFSFLPDPDPFSPTPIDLRPLNERQAGDGGFIRPKGRDLVHEATGQPIRFWAVTAGHEVLWLPDEKLQTYARWLAKLGVNLVRLHGPFWQDQDLGQVDPKKLERLHRFESALRDQGIYLGLSTLFPLWLDLDEKRHGFAGYRSQPPFGLLFFDPKFQELHRAWLRQLLTTKNPYTGLALAQDPALAYVELINEDSTLFWTFKPGETIPGPATYELESQFGRWLAQRYGSLGQALQRWGGKARPRDDLATGAAEVMPPGDLSPQRGARAQDTAEFLTRLMRDTYQSLNGLLHRDLGYRGTTVCSNWQTADPRVLDPLDKWANTVCDVMDHHGYYGGPHHGPAADYSVNAGDRYDDATALRFESPAKDSGPRQLFSLPIMDLVVNGKPSFVSELGWTSPNRYRADFPVLAAAYGALQGTDAVVLFAHALPGWATALGKFTIAEPTILGQSPAAALTYRSGLVREAPPIGTLGLSTAEMFALKGADLPHAANVDRGGLKAWLKRGLFPRADGPAIDPLAPLVGPVELSLSDLPQRSLIPDLSDLIDRRHQIIRSQTGELVWNYGRGLLTIGTATVQAATGFLTDAGRIDLPQVALTMCQDYGAVWLVALDGKPLAESALLLLQVASESMNSGWSAPGDGLRTIESTGGFPIMVRNLCGVVQLKRPDASALQVVALDFGGYPKRRALQGADHIVLLPDVMYYLIEKSTAR